MKIGVVVTDDVNAVENCENEIKKIATIIANLIVLAVLSFHPVKINLGSVLKSIK